jgi:hypothetical protein
MNVEPREVVTVAQLPVPRLIRGLSLDSASFIY